MKLIFAINLIAISLMLISMNTGKNLYDDLNQYILQRTNEFDRIPEERQLKLIEIADFVISRTSDNSIARLTFICTHNSRRSHMGQIWAQAAAFFYGFQNVETFSGGTEATAFNPRAVQALKDTGFRIEKIDETDNPVYTVAYAPDASPIHAHSKKYDSGNNPREDFCAIMTCSQADTECPFIPGASERIAIPYEDPKNADGTDRETEAYAERCEQIALEMLFLFSQVKR
jgi:protein-tyrosine-phosphatase